VIVPPKEAADRAEDPRSATDSAVAGPTAEPGGESSADERYSEEEYLKLKAAYRELRDRATRAELLLLEREARIQELEQRLEQQQRLIAEAINEVVRAKAKLRGVESRAEAASQMAEAEIALEALAGLSGGTRNPEYTQAAELLQRASQAFEEENYGGAIYLTSQAKSLISQAELRIRDRARVDTAAGEVVFSVPLSLRVTRRSNLRKGPGLDFAVVKVLEPGTPLTGYSYRGKWVRVQLEDGSRGWIYQALLGER
jgi:uncharacterized coiled-coil protein SlyX